MTRAQLKPIFATLSLGLLAGLSGGLALSQPGCAAEQCQGESGDQDKPSPAIECGTGFLCYRGACVESCNAGAERVTRCATDDECTDSIRDTCVSGFCSSCQENEVCVPRLNICERIRDTIRDASTRDAGRPSAHDPLDGGQIDGSIFRLTDSGVEEVINVPVSHYGNVTLERVENAINGTFSTAVRATVLDVRSSTITTTPPEVDDSDRNPYVSCEIAPLLNPQPPVQVGIGDIIVDGDLRGGTSGSYTLKFNGQAYASAATPPADLLVFTAPGNERTLEVYGSGDRVNFFGFPTPNSPTHLIPYELTIPGDMLNRLRSGFSVANPPADAIEFKWLQPFTCPAGAPDQCHGRGHSVVVRVVSDTHEMLCEGPEISPIRLTEPFLRKFRELARIPPATTLPLFFERRYLSQMSIPSNLEGKVRIRMDVVIAHSYQSRILFQ